MSATPILVLSLLFPLVRQDAQGARAAREEPALTASALAGEIDTSLRALRGLQEPGSGSYGGLDATAKVLLALAESPRGYRFGDGPFVDRAVRWLVGQQKPDGTIADPDATPERTHQQTALAAAALERTGGAPGREAAERARGVLGENAASAVPDAGELADAPEELLLRRAAKILAERGEDRLWSPSERGGEGAGNEGRAAASARSVLELGLLHAELALRAGPREPGRAQPLAKASPAGKEEALRAIERGARFLVSQADEDGRYGFDGRADPGITAMVAGALLAVPEPRPDDVAGAIDRALDWLVSLAKPDGSIHAGTLQNYVTSASILALARAGRDGEEEIVAAARAFLEGLQADEGEGYAPGDRYYGGVGYGGDERPDLSNLQMAIEALAEAGTPKGDESFRKALVFLERCQNRSESNDLRVEGDAGLVLSGDDGGGAYAPGESKAGYVELADGRRIPRSYGSMTYALFKSYLFAGLERDDPRVEAAWKWIRERYTLDENPGFEASDDPTAAYQGLFYYYATMARALDLYGVEEVPTPGGPRRWREELAGRLVSMQRADGSWVNHNAARWYEGNPVLATAYALQTLEVVVREEGGR